MRAAIKRMSLQLRARAPSVLRTLYRAAQSTGPVHISQALPPELVRDCRFCVSRADMLQFLPHGGIVAELGTDRGDFARQIMTVTEPRQLHVIDLDYSRFDERGLADGRVTRHQGLTHEVIATFPDATFDWIYVDADHSYDGVIRDARASAAKVKPGGFLAFNDFTHIDTSLGRYGVHRAVVDFAVERRWPFRYFAFQEGGNYDVALRRPDADDAAPAAP